MGIFLIAKINRKHALCAAIAAVVGSTSATAQQTPPGARMIEELTVTARKREETLLEVPVAITAFSRDDLIAADITGLDDVSGLTAGFQFFNQGNQQPGRYNTQLQFRGLTTAQFSPSFATGALFIDGVYVLNGGTSVALMDLERIGGHQGTTVSLFRTQHLRWRRKHDHTRPEPPRVQCRYRTIYLNPS